MWNQGGLDLLDQVTALRRRLSIAQVLQKVFHLIMFLLERIEDVRRLHIDIARRERVNKGARGFPTVLTGMELSVDSLRYRRDCMDLAALTNSTPAPTASSNARSGFFL